MFATIQDAKAAAEIQVPGELNPGETVEMAIVEDKISSASEGHPEQPFHFCPAEAVFLLHRFGTTVEKFTITRAV